MPHVQGPHPPLVTIVLPCFVTSDAALRRLDETLASIDAQSCGDAEVMVVDDGSPVDVARLVARHPRTFTVRQPNAGPAVARNTGIDLSRGSTFVFVDADDHLLPRALEDGLAVLEAHPEVGFTVGAQEEMTWEGVPVPGTAIAPPAQRQLYLPLLAGQWSLGAPSCAMFRRTVVEALGGFRDPWGADVLDFCLRAAYRFEAQRVDGAPVTRHRRCHTTAGPDVERRLQSLHAVYDRQWALVRGNPEAEAAHAHGLRALSARAVPSGVGGAAEARRAEPHVRSIASTDVAALGPRDAVGVAYSPT